jgi:hypothetical protein
MAPEWRELQYKTTRGSSINPERRPAGAVVEMRFAQVSYGSVDSCLPRHSACGLWLYTTEPYSFRNLPDCSSGCSDLLGLIRFWEQCHHDQVVVVSIELARSA